MHHTPEKWIFYDDIKEITVVIGEKSVNREFTSKHSQIYKGYTLVSFDDENFKPQDKEFQEPIGITKPYHPHPIFKIDNGRDIEINSKNKAWWLIESDSCPCH
uniref:MannoseP_isomer domain-containing protein n=1 Tax=Strongyloides venezuelensis TaxID=75913 RepID=A0A0K0FEY6_STRVS